MPAAEESPPDATGTTAEEWAAWRSFLAVHARLSLAMDRRLRSAHGMTQSEYGSLAAIRDAPDGVLRVGRLAVLLGWERSRVSHLVTRLEQRGLVERRPCATDARATELRLTGAGRRALLGAVRDHAADLRDLFLDRMTASEREVMVRVFTRILDHVEQAEPLEP